MRGCEDSSVLSLEENETIYRSFDADAAKLLELLGLDEITLYNVKFYNWEKFIKTALFAHGFVMLSLECAWS